MVTILLYAGLLLGAGIALYGGILTGVAEPGEKHGPVGLTLLGALLYGAAGWSVWHWSVMLTVAILFMTYAFAVFASKEKLNG